MSNIRLAVIGCGHLGRIHARLAKQLNGAELVSIVDSSQAARKQVSDSVGAPGFADYRLLIDRIDAAIVATPTVSHAAIAHDLISHGIHVLVEKPLTMDLDAAQSLVAAANKKEVTLAVGHVERFNPAFAAAQQKIRRPTYIETVRSAGFSFRSTDIGVVFDLMIHDLDLVRALVGSPVVDVTATGWPVMTSQEDIAEARLTFANGCVAQLKASRVDLQNERRLCVYEPHQQTVVDFSERSVKQITQSRSVRDRSWNTDGMTPEHVAANRDQLFQELMPVAELDVPQANPLADEQQDFVDSICEGRPPRVGGQDAHETVKLAMEVVRRIETQRGTRRKAA